MVEWITPFNHVFLQLIDLQIELFNSRTLIVILEWVTEPVASGDRRQSRLQTLTEPRL